MLTDIQLFSGIVSGALLFIGLWQIEMMWLHKAWGKQGFVLPFGREVPWWFARDLWYGCIIGGYVVLILAK
jgi:hypothetical protein